MSRSRALFTLVFLSFLVALAACGHTRVNWTAQPLQTNIVRIMPANIKARGALLYIETTFYNVGDKPIVVDRDGARLILYNGRVLTRSQGTFTRHEPYFIPPGAARAVHVDFRSDGFDWRDMGQVAVDFSAAVLIDGVPVQLPPLVATSYEPG